MHIVIYAVMLFVKGYKNQSLSDRILAVFLFFSALFICPWMVGFAGWYDNQPYRDILFYTPFVHGLVLGPLLFLYTKSYSNFNYKLQKADLLHFIPAALYVIYTIVMIVYDKFIVERYAIMDGEQDPDFDLWYQIAIKISMISYAWITLKFYRQYKRYTNYESSFVDKLHLNWLRNFIVAVVIIAALPVVDDILQAIGFFGGANQYVSHWFFHVAYALVVYYIAINGFHNAIDARANLYFEPELLLAYVQQQPLLLGENNVEDVAYEIVDKNEEAALLEQWKHKIDQLIQSEKLYENEDLTLTFLAKKLKTNVSLLSRVINHGYGLNFNDFINGYRIKAFQEKLKNNEHQRQTLLSLAFECGFNSKATFNRAFKKVTNCSPSEWMRKLTQE